MFFFKVFRGRTGVIIHPDEAIRKSRLSAEWCQIHPWNCDTNVAALFFLCMPLEEHCVRFFRFPKLFPGSLFSLRETKERELSCSRLPMHHWFADSLLPLLFMLQYLFSSVKTADFKSYNTLLWKVKKAQCRFSISLVCFPDFCFAWHQTETTLIAVRS